jgi:LPXTG-site transpeptidase (sortase) family protein
MALKFSFQIIFIFLLFLFYDVEQLGNSEYGISEPSYFIKIPSISLNETLCSESREACLEKNFVWIKKYDYSGNMLLTAHSFNLLPLRAGPFFGLADLKVGDRIVLYLDLEQIYEIYEIYVTDRYDLSVEEFPSLGNTLVLYTCYPVWTANERIVVRAKLCDLCENEI